MGMAGEACEGWHDIITIISNSKNGPSIILGTNTIDGDGWGAWANSIPCIAKSLLFHSSYHLRLSVIFFFCLLEEQLREWRSSCCCCCCCLIHHRGDWSHRCATAAPAAVAAKSTTESHAAAAVDVITLPTDNVQVLRDAYFSACTNACNIKHNRRAMMGILIIFYEAI